MGGKKAGGLGRGLDALFNDSTIDQEVPVDPDSSELKAYEMSPDSVNFLDVNELKPNAYQPRKDFDEDKIKDLADSIKMHGMIQPIIVRPVDNGFEIIAGERRWRAARIAQLKTVPCIVKDLTERENMLIALIENMQREDLNSIEEAVAFREMMTRYGLTQEEVSNSVGKSRPYIANALRLLKLPEEIKNMVIEGKISGGHARAIAGVEGGKRQIEIAQLTVRKDLSVRALEQLIASLDQDEKTSKRKREKNPELISIEGELKDLLGTKVSVSSNGKKGKIEISFFSPDDFDRIIASLKQIQS